MKYLFEYLISEGSSKARVKSRERLYERYFLIQVTCNMNTKGQTWNENIWIVTRPDEESPSLQP